MKFIVFLNRNNEVNELTDKIVAQLKIFADDVDVFDFITTSFDEMVNLISGYDIAIAVGGDGTTLKVAKAAAICSKLALGINAGRLGFMSGIEGDELHLLSTLKYSDYQIDNRLMLNACVELDGVVHNYPCLNDAVISRGDIARLIDISVSTEDRFVTNTRADGMIVATPTGSTAYSMAAGGPVVSPETDCFVVTPISPHSLINRSIIFATDKELRLTVNNDKGNIAYLSIDGDNSIKLKNGATITITKSEYTARLIKIKPENFYEILSKKIIERRN